jgi:hypothetical protein
MTYSAVAKNTKTGITVSNTISFKVVLFAQALPIGSLASQALSVGMVSSYENQISSLLPKAIRYYESYCYK